MSVSWLKREAYIRLDAPDQWVRATKFWKKAEPDMDLAIMLTVSSILAWGWVLSEDVGSGERFYVGLRGPLSAGAADLYSVEELVVGNREVDKYMFDD